MSDNDLRHLCNLPCTVLMTKCFVTIIFIAGKKYDLSLFSLDNYNVYVYGLCIH